MSRKTKLFIAMLGLLVAFPFLYPISRSFFRGIAANRLARNMRLVTTDNQIDRSAGSTPANANGHLTKPDLPRPDLVMASGETQATENAGEWQLVMHAPGTETESFRLLVGVGGRVGIDSAQSILASPSGSNVQFWDLEQDSLIETRRINPEDNNTLFRCARYAPDGQYLALGSPFGAMQVMRISDKSLMPMPTDRSISGVRIAFHPKGNKLVAVGERFEDGRTIPNAHWVDLGSGQSQQFVPNETKVVDVAVSDDGQWIAVAGTESFAIYDTTTLEQKTQFSLNLEPTCVVPRGDGTWLVGMSDGTVRTWNAKTETWIPNQNIDTGPRRVIAIDRFDDRNRICILTGEEKILIWDLTKSTSRLVGHHETAHCIRVRPGDHELVTVGFKNGTRVWPLADSRTIAQVRESEQEDSLNLAWSLITVSADGSTMAALGDLVHVWNVEDGSCVAAFEPKTRWIKDIHLSPDGSLIAMVGEGLKTEVWSVTENRHYGNFVDPKGESRWSRNIDRRSRCVRFSADGKRLMVAEQDALRIYDVQSRERVVELAEVARKTGTVLISMIQAMGTHEKTGRIALAQSRRIVIWDPKDERVLKTVKIKSSPAGEHPGIFFSDDGDQIVVCHDRYVVVYDIETGRDLDELRNHWVHGNLDGRWLVSNRNGQLSLWSPATEYVPPYERRRRQPDLIPLMKLRGQLKDVALLRDGKIVLIDQRDKPLVFSPK